MAYESEPLKAVSPEMVLDKVSEIEILEYYLQISVQFTSLFVSPSIIRSSDTSPGCKFLFNGIKVKYIDFAAGINEDCFGIVSYIYGLNFDQSITRICKDFRLYGHSSNSIAPKKSNSLLGELKEKPKAKFNYQYLQWEEVDIKFWTKRHIHSKELKKYNVSSIKYIFHNNKLIYTRKPSDVCYVYEFEDNTVQFYFPNRKTRRFLTNSKWVMGWEHLPPSGENVIITKSLKDIILVSEIYGFPSIGKIGENTLIEEMYVNDLRERFNNIFLLNDNDEAGRRATEKINKVYKDFIPIFYEEDLGKDTDEVTMNIGTVETQEVLNQMIL